ncbi:MAG TPA: cupredoxin domain-containing protein [Gaiellaceae bacterium]|nr:cupredoxin domain-containing protein [Gaiellaceae bacterium]
MKTALVLAAAAAALVAAGAAGAETKTVQITRQGFTPTSTTVNVGDSITWRNADTASHQVVANDGSFASPVLKSGETYTFTFAKSGKFAYHDSFASKNGSVTVNAPPANVTLTATSPTITYGDNTTVSGVVTNQLTNEPVTLNAQPVGKGTQSLATTTTQAGGAFSFGVAPTIQTAYRAQWRTTSSPPVTIAVAPRVGFGRSGARYVAKVTSDLNYAGHYVWVQRKAPGGGFRNVRRVYLGATSRAVFTLRLVKGPSILRLVLPDTQAGVGYVASSSRLIAVTKR